MKPAGLKRNPEGVGAAAQRLVGSQINVNRKCTPLKAYFKTINQNEETMFSLLFWDVMNKSKLDHSYYYEHVFRTTSSYFWPHHSRISFQFLYISFYLGEIISHVKKNFCWYVQDIMRVLMPTLGCSDINFQILSSCSAAILNQGLSF